MSTSTASTFFEETVRVAPEDIDFMGHVSNIVYLRWVQDVATAHWQRLASPEVQEQLLWVVSRHEIDYKQAAFLNDEIRLQTRLGTAHGLLFERHTQISRASDGQVLAVARTLWIPVNSETKKPQRLSRELRALFSVKEPETPKSQP